jgi:hypothetical protein
MPVSRCTAQAKEAPHEAQRAGSRVRFPTPAGSLRPERCSTGFPAATRVVSRGGAEVTFQRTRSIRPRFRPGAAKVLGGGVASPHQNDHRYCNASFNRDIVQPKSLAPDVSASEKDPCAVQLIGFVGAAVPSGCRHRQGCTLGRTDSRNCTRLRCCGPRRYRGCF